MIRNELVNYVFAIYVAMFYSTCYIFAQVLYICMKQKIDIERQRIKWKKCKMSEP